MSTTPAIIVRSASPRPYALAPSLAVSPQFSGNGWVCSDHMSIEHNPTTTDGSKRLGPGFLTGVLT